MRILRVYPRACGATRRWPDATVTWGGLSPRVRGNRSPTWCWLCRWGSIPARAGQPAQSARQHRDTGVYPRACGATLKAPASPWGVMGLSPRVRGNLYVYRGALTPVGSIPARAGQPDIDWVIAGGERVYPRACGATVLTEGRKIGAWGLSPRVRGNLAYEHVKAALDRSIPARAGQPDTQSHHLRPLPVYPRACGATDVGLVDVRCRDGLSPRVRGNPLDQVGLAVGIGSIPARAGQPRCLCPSYPRSGVYPRACGATHFIQGIWGVT